jgi:sugar lactone lactonase YvrE
MIPERHSLQDTTFNPSFRRLFDSWPKLGRLAALSALLAALVGGARDSAAAQNGFTYAQRTIGSGFNGPNGVTLDSSGNIFVAVMQSNAVYEILAADGYTTVKTVGSGFKLPSSVAVDGSGNVFVADFGNYLVKEIVAVDGVVSSTSTVKTIGSGFAEPSGVAVDGSGNVFVADQGATAVKEIVAVGGVVSGTSTVKIVGSGFTGPSDVAVDRTGNVFVTDTQGHAVKEIVAAGGVVSSTSTVKTLGSGFVTPNGIAVDGSGNVFVSDDGDKPGGDNLFKEIVAVGGSVSSTSEVKTLGGSYSMPAGVAVDANGDVFVIDWASTAVTELMMGAVNFGSQAVGTTSTPVTMNFSIPAGAQVGSFAFTTLGNKNMDFADAGGATCTAGTYTATTSCALNVTFTPQAPGLRRGGLAIFDGSGNQLGSFRLYGNGQGPQAVLNGSTPTVTSPTPNMGFAVRVVTDGAGNIFVASWADAAFDPNTGSVIEYPRTSGGYGAPVTLMSGISELNELFLDGAGNLFILSRADQQNHSHTGFWGGFQKNANGYGPLVKLATGLNYPLGLVMDSNENAYIVGRGNDGTGTLVEIGTNGASTTLASGLGDPDAIAMDAAGNLFITTYQDANLDPSSGTLVALQKTPSGYSSPITIATGISYPAGVFVEPNENVLVASGSDYNQDTGTGAILEYPFTGSGFSGPVTLATGITGTQGVTMDTEGNVIFPDPGNALVDLLPRMTPSLSFAQTVRGTTSADSPRAVTVENIGNQPLSFSALSYPLDFPEAAGQSTDCTSSTTLMPNQTCTLTASFEPVTPIPVIAMGRPLMLTENAAITTNSLNASAAVQQVSLSGTEAPAAIGSSVTLAVSNTTPHPGDLITLTATVTGMGGTPTGSVSFYVGATQVGWAVTLKSGVATLSIVLPASGSVTAVYAGDTNYTSATSNAVTVTPAKGTATVTLGNLNQTYTGSPLSATATTVPANMTVNFTYNGSATAPTAAGAYTVVGTVSDTNYEGTATGTMTIAKATATVTLGSLSQTYTGSPLSATATTTPANLTVTFTYNGSATAPTGVGTYTVVGTVSDSNYQGTATGTMTIAKATATVTLGSLNQTYTGSPLSATATTAPANLTVTFTYNGNATPPTHAGSYAVVATINDSYFQGTATGTLVIAKAASKVTWSKPAAIVQGTPLSSSQLNATASVPGTFAYSPAAGALLPAGYDTVSVTFTPTDAVDYATASSSVVITVENPLPVITSVSPSSIAGTTNSFYITVTGSNFSPGDTVNVWWSDNSDITLYSSTTFTYTLDTNVTYVSSTQFQIQVVGGQMKQQGIAAVQITAPSPTIGSGNSNYAPIVVTSSASVTYQPNISPSQVVVTAGTSATYSVTMGQNASTMNIKYVSCASPPPADLGPGQTEAATLPPGVSCSYNPSTHALTVATTSATPPGNYLLVMVFTVFVPTGLVWAGYIPFIFMTFVSCRKRSARKHILVYGCLAALLLVGVLGMSSCGSTSTTPVTTTAIVNLVVQ